MKIENLNYILENDSIAELFGRQNFSTKESAILELVKNSFDANSSTCKIIFDSNKLSILDDGEGMDANDIRNYWMHIGKSDKGYKKNDRVLAGSKGVGRFALARLGNAITMVSKKENDGGGIEWETNWESNELRSEIEVAETKGTKIYISQLRDRWTEKTKNDLIEFLNRVTNSRKTKVLVKTTPESEYKEITPIFLKEIKLGDSCVSKFTLKYDANSMKLEVTIDSDEFSDKVIELGISEYNTKKYFLEIDMAKEFSPDIEKGDVSAEELKEIGNFEASFYFSLSNTTKDDVERFMYKHDRLLHRINEGIVLYRNDFSISSLEGRKDWLELGARSRRSPAAASHPTGQWRIRANQLSGFVFIDKKENDKLVDLANRQGLDENDYYDYFKKIIEKGIETFEDYRQKIIRDIVNFQDAHSPKIDSPKPLLTDFLKRPNKISKYDEKELEQLTSEITAVKKNSEESERKRVESEENYRYDARILNLLATQGLKAESTAHELRADRSTIGNNYNLIVNALKSLGYWESLNSKENKKFEFRNVPALLEKSEKVNAKLRVFLDSMLDQIEKKRFNEIIPSLEQYFDSLKKKWENDYTWVKISITNSGNSDKFSLTTDILDVILENLILNSIQQNEDKEKLNIIIDYGVNFDNEMLFSYCDDGKGLSEKYSEDPFKILKVHESTRDSGHGLGMWLLNKSVDSQKGKITAIYNNSGFHIDFNLRGDK